MDVAKKRQPVSTQPCDLRCGCGSLLARQRADGIELKCRRCRRCMLLRWEADGSISVNELGQGELA